MTKSEDDAPAAKADLKVVKADLKADVKAVEIDLKADIRRLDEKFDRMAADQVRMRESMATSSACTASPSSPLRRASVLRQGPLPRRPD